MPLAGIGAIHAGLQYVVAKLEIFTFIQNNLIFIASPQGLVSYVGSVLVVMLSLYLFCDWSCNLQTV